MCTANVASNAEQPLADLLIRMRDILAGWHHIDPELVTIGPIDLGTHSTASPTVTTR